MKLLVGLGNPGPRYQATRHNVGARVVERFAETRGIPLDESRFEGRFGRGHLARTRAGAEATSLELSILTPATFMNRSGGAVVEALDRLGMEAADLLVVLDDVDLPFGRLRIRPKGSAGGHRGLSDVIECVGHGEFPRLRFGVGRSEQPLDTADWVLQAFSREEERVLRGRIDTAAEAVEATLVDGVVPAMTRYNRAPESESR